MKTYDVNFISKKSVNRDEFLIFFESYIKRSDVDLDTSLDVLRISGVYFNRFSLQSEKEYNDCFSMCIEFLFNEYPECKSEITDFKKQCKMMHDISNSFFDSIKGSNVFNDKLKISSEVLTHFIVLCEIYLSAFLFIMSGRKNDDLHKILPIKIQSPNFSLDGLSVVETFKSLSRGFDEVVMYTGKVYYYLKRTGPLKVAVNLEKSKLSSVSQHLDEWNLFDSLGRINDFFRLNNASVTQLENGEYLIKAPEDCLYRDYEVARSRMMLRSHNLHNELSLQYKEDYPLIDNRSSEVPPYLTKQGFFDAVYLSQLEHMAPKDLHEEYGGVSLYDWVHAYQSLVNLSSETIKKRLAQRKIKTLDIDKWLIIKSRKNWISFFQRNGLSVKVAKKVLDYFTFNDLAQDLNDCPLMICEGGLCLMPALTSSSSTVRSLMSLFSSKKINLTNKGGCFEEQFIKDALNAGVNAKPLAIHKDFECDCVMLIDNHLIFTELKSNGHPVFFGKYYQTVCNIKGDHSLIYDKNNKKFRSYFQQVNRYTEHYLKHLDLIIELFNLPANWSPSGIYKLIVTTSVLGGKYHDDNCYVVDKFAMTSFFHRSPGSINDSENGNRIGRIDQKGYDCCLGEITIGKLVDYLELLPSINYTRKNIKKLTYNVDFNGVKVHYPYYDSWLGEPFIQTRNR